MAARSFGPSSGRALLAQSFSRYLGFADEGAARTDLQLADAQGFRKVRPGVDASAKACKGSSRHHERVGAARMIRAVQRRHGLRRMFRVRERFLIQALVDKKRSEPRFTHGYQRVALAETATRYPKRFLLKG